MVVSEPTITVEIAWTDNFAEPFPVWTDITGYVERVKPSGGRSNEIGQIETSTLNLTLNNTGGEFTPNRAGSPFFPNVVPMRQVRVRATEADGTVNDLFRGPIERWPVGFDSLLSSITVTAISFTESLAAAPLESIMDYEINKLGPVDYWGPTSFTITRNFSASGSGREMNLRVTPQWNAVGYSNDADGWNIRANPIVPVADESTRSLELSGAVRMSGNGLTDVDCGFYLDVDTPYRNPRNAAFTIMTYFQLDNFPAGAEDNPTVFNWEWHTTYHYDDIWIRVYVERDSTSDNGRYILEAGDWRNESRNLLVYSYISGDGEFHPVKGVPFFISVAWEPNELRFDTRVNDVTKTYHPVDNFKYSAGDLTWSMLGYNWKWQGGDAGGLANAKIQHTARFDRALSSLETEAIYRAGLGRQGDTAEERIAYLLDMAEWPTELRDLGETTTPMQPLVISESDNALAKSRDVAEDALGLFYGDNAGRLVFEPRRARPTAPVKWVLDHDDGTAPEAGLEFESAVGDIVNYVKVESGDEGVNQTVRNRESERMYGKRSKDISLKITDDTEAINHAHYYANRYGTPTVRVNGLSVNPTAQSDGKLWAFVCGVRYSDRIRISGLPENAPASTMDFFIESINHDIVRDGNRLVWSSTFDISPAELRAGWVVGDPEKSIVGETTRLHF